MGTCNFYLQNASHYYVVCKPYEILDENDEPTGEYEYEQWDYDSDVEWFKDYIKEQADKHHAIDYNSDLPSMIENDRNFPESGLGTLDIMSGYFSIRIQCIIRSGYYEACNLDWRYRIELESGDDWDTNDTDEIKQALTDYLMDEGIDKATAIIKATANIIQLEQDINTLIEFVENCFAVLSGEDQYVSGGRFSNGEQLLIKTI
jgi:hypothetical protein